VKRLPNYLDFTVSLQGVLPRPWRRFLLSERATFATLHAAIQDACGWTNSHLYDFRGTAQEGPDVIAGIRLEDQDYEVPRHAPDATATRVTSYFGPDKFTTCLYVYDFGDDWRHDLQLNDVVTLSDEFARRLVGGEHAFPPEDCGGYPGYASIQRVLATGKDPEGLLNWARDTWEWTGVFDLHAARSRFDRRG
jgi:uncharacterized protein